MVTRTMSFLRVASSRRISAHGVFPRRDWLKVRRIDANPVPTEMVDLQAIRNRPDVHFVVDAVQQRSPSIRHLPLTITGGIGLQLRYPTTIIRDRVLVPFGFINSRHVRYII